jgi:hypothetical protein
MQANSVTVRFVCLANSAATRGVALLASLEFSPWHYIFKLAHNAYPD